MPKSVVNNQLGHATAPAGSLSGVETEDRHYDRTYRGGPSQDLLVIAAAPMNVPFPGGAVPVPRTFWLEWAYTVPFGGDTPRGIAFPIIGVDQGAKKFTVAGDWVADYDYPDHLFYVELSTGNDDEYTIVGAALVGGDTEIEVNEPIADVTVDGIAIKPIVLGASGLAGTDGILLPIRGTGAFAVDQSQRYDRVAVFIDGLWAQIADTFSPLRTFAVHPDGDKILLWYNRLYAPAEEGLPTDPDSAAGSTVSVWYSVPSV